MHKLISACAFPFPIFGLTGDQSPLNKYFEDWDHDDAVLN